MQTYLQWTHIHPYSGFNDVKTTLEQYIINPQHKIPYSGCQEIIPQKYHKQEVVLQNIHQSHPPINHQQIGPHHQTSLRVHVRVGNFMYSLVQAVIIAHNEIK